MKTVTATEANRDFSRLLDRAAHGEAVGITKRGRVVAKIVPAAPDAAKKAEAFKRKHLARLRKQPLMGIPRGTRDDLYSE